MKDGFIKIATATPKVRVADCEYNEKAICDLIDRAKMQRVNVLVFPELCITAKTCADLFLHDVLLENSKKALLNIVEYSRNEKDMLIFVGLPFMLDSKLYNVAAAINNGELLGLVPKTQACDDRYFSTCESNRYINVNEKQVAFGAKLIFKCKSMPELSVAAELGEELFTIPSRAEGYAKNGATLIVNLAADYEGVQRAEYRHNAVISQSSRLLCAYAFANAGEGESTQDMVFSGHSVIAENGKIISERDAFVTGVNAGVADLRKLRNERRALKTFSGVLEDEYETVEFDINLNDVNCIDAFDKMPFLPDHADMAKRCETILSIQAYGLKKRLEHTGIKNAVIGVSGGLDSTLALLALVKTFDMMGLPRTNIKAITMPCFGTSGKTYQNAIKLIKLLECDFEEINIVKSIRQHFEDIGQDENVQDVTFENAQARERTQILMDIANKVNGMVIGTGDLSELVLGFATYNGDHMSMYGLNASIPKTLVRYLVEYVAMKSDNEIMEVLMEIAKTPVSPELLPPKEGEISQQTEDIVGPYKLHDFFIYHTLRHFIAPKKLFRMAKATFYDEYSDETILKWMKTFYRRFFAQQFKRSCLPDGPKVGSISVSPRGDLKMPSDAVAKLWLDELEQM